MNHPHQTSRLRRPFFDASFILITIFAVLFLVLLYITHKHFIIPGLIPAGLVPVTLLYLGFGLPKWHRRQMKNNRALQAKDEELKRWGLCSRDREGPWITYIDFPVAKRTGLAAGKYFYSEWLIIHDGLIVVNPGRAEVDLQQGTVAYDFSANRTYAWDGCTPKRSFFWLALIGTPDWGEHLEDIQTIGASGEILEREVFWPQAHHASLIHDALYQYLNTIPISKSDVDRLFHEMLTKSGLPRSLAYLYYLAVRLFGARDIPKVDSKPNSDFKNTNFPGHN